MDFCERDFASAQFPKGDLQLPCDKSEYSQGDQDLKPPNQPFLSQTARCRGNSDAMLVGRQIRSPWM